MTTDLKKFLGKNYSLGEEPPQDKTQYEESLDVFEKEILSRVKSKTPLVVAKEMRNIFIEKYSGAAEAMESEKAQLATDFLLASKTWPRLDVASRDMARALTDEGHKDYWGAMRSLWRRFPGDRREAERRSARQASDVDDSFENVFKIKGLGHCDYCWRTVPIRRGKTGVRKCHLHADEKKGHALTQKSRDILTKKMHINLNQKSSILFNPEVRKHLDFFNPYVCPPICIAESAREEVKTNGDTLMDAWNSFPSGVVHAFPYVEKYLLEGGVDTGSTYEVVRALDMPFDIRREKNLARNLLGAFRLRDEFYQSYYKHISMTIMMDEGVNEYLKDNGLFFADQLEIFELFEQIRVEKNRDILGPLEERVVKCFEAYYELYRKHFVPIIMNNKFVVSRFNDFSVVLDSPISVAKGFQMVCYPGERRDAISLKKKYYIVSEGFFGECYETLVLAERWLGAEAGLKHGGKRKGAGRKPKK